MRRPRDSQRRRCYRAEAELRGKYPLPRDDVQGFVDHVTRSSWWLLNSACTVRVVLKLRESGRHGWARGRGSYALVSLPPWAWDKLYVLHELAHHATGMPRHQAYHGPEFIQTLHDMIREFLGSEDAAIYRAGCQRERVEPFVSHWPHLAPRPLPVAASVPASEHRLTRSEELYLESYRRYLRGERASRPKLRKGMTRDMADYLEGLA